MTPALRLLTQGAAALGRSLQPSGELYDPVFGEPTQYGTAYFAYVNAAIGQLSRGHGPGPYFERAERGLAAALRHLLDPTSPPATSSYAPPIASPTALNHRDFMWLAVLRGLQVLRAAGCSGSGILAQQVQTVAVPDVFAARAPSNWASVWILGEWLRIREGLSPHVPDVVDAWLEPFFDGPDARVDLAAGCYYEPGLPNSYDLFTRYHLLELLAEGYEGRYRPALRELLEAGLRRSLAVQLSNGSLASAHRSTGQLWALTAQCAYFHRAADMCAGGRLAARAREAALRSFAAARGSRRPDGGLSPVENVLPANFRVGYEQYTADAHYVSLALAFLAGAALAGFSGSGPAAESLQDVEGPEGVGGAECVHVEAEPLWRSLLHAEGWSVHVNLAPAQGYDPFGIADVSPGPGRWLRFGGQVRHVATGSPITLGIAVRGPDGSVRPISAARSVERRFARRLEGDGAKDRAKDQACTLEAGALADGLPYEVRAAVVGGELCVVESAGGQGCSLVVPYVRDRGDGAHPRVEPGPSGLRLSVQGESLEVVTERSVARAVHLPHGYESRHGLVGVVRLDLAGSGPVAYRLRRGGR